MKILSVIFIALAIAAPATPQGVLWADQPADITFVSAGEAVLVIHADGRITASKRAKPDDAAREVLRSLETMLRSRPCAKVSK